jgi:hypothetical protein
MFRTTRRHNQQNHNLHALEGVKRACLRTFPGANLPCRPEGTLLVRASILPTDRTVVAYGTSRRTIATRIRVFPCGNPFPALLGKFVILRISNPEESQSRRENATILMGKQERERLTRGKCEGCCGALLHESRNISKIWISNSNMDLTSRSSVTKIK